MLVENLTGDMRLAIGTLTFVFGKSDGQRLFEVEVKHITIDIATTRRHQGLRD